MRIAEERLSTKWKDLSWIRWTATDKLRNEAAEGKVFTLTSMHLLIDQTRIREYRSR